jgi:hypothetical protein
MPNNAPTQRTPLVDEVGNTAGTMALVVGIPGSILGIALCVSFTMWGAQGGNEFIMWSVIGTYATVFPLVLLGAWAIEYHRG